MARYFCLIVVVWSFAAGIHAQEKPHVDESLLFYSTFDDTTDVNLFGPDNDAGWIYSAESTRRNDVLMNNRSAAVAIEAGKGRLGDCLTFSAATKRVLFYQASPNLPFPRRNWLGAVSLWLRPKQSVQGNRECYPILFYDGDWARGGFYLRLPSGPRAKLEFGTVSSGDRPQTISWPREIPMDARQIVTFDGDQMKRREWMMVTFTFENVNPGDGNDCLCKLYIDGELVGQMRQSLQIRWMDPADGKAEQEAAVFLGVNYVGGIDDLRIYGRALSANRVRRLYQAAQETD